jgi:hypothetical protein
MFKVVSSIFLEEGKKIMETFFLFILNQQSEYKVFCKLMGWLGVLTCRHSSVMRSLPARGSGSPHYRSVGHRICNRRMTLSRRGGCSKRFGWDSSFVRCFILLAWMTS